MLYKKSGDNTIICYTCIKFEYHMFLLCTRTVRVHVIPRKGNLVYIILYTDYKSIFIKATM